jgi:hypothetical protein
MAASRRAEQRRLLSYVRMVDLMVADTLHTCLVASASELLAVAQPPPTIRPIAQRTSELWLFLPEAPASSSMPATVAAAATTAAAAAAAASDGPASPGNKSPPRLESAGQQQAGSSRLPMFCVEVVLEGDCVGFKFEPRPEDFKAKVAEVLAGFRTCATGIGRLSAEVRGCAPSPAALALLITPLWRNFSSSLVQHAPWIAIPSHAQMFCRGRPPTCCHTCRSSSCAAWWARQTLTWRRRPRPWRNWWWARTLRRW